jgi:hypothetical protein
MKKLEKMGISMSSRDIPERTDGLGFGVGTHYEIILTIGESMRTFEYSQGAAHLEPPELVDVMCCLYAEANFDGSFDDFCDQYGFNNDSIKALKTYGSCVDTKAFLDKALTTEQRNTLEEIYNEW